MKYTLPIPAIAALPEGVGFMQAVKDMHPGTAVSVPLAVTSETNLRTRVSTLSRNDVYTDTPLRVESIYDSKGSKTSMLVMREGVTSPEAIPVMWVNCTADQITDYVRAIGLPMAAFLNALGSVYRNSGSLRVNDFTRAAQISMAILLLKYPVRFACTLPAGYSDGFTELVARLRGEYTVGQFVALLRSAARS